MGGVERAGVRGRWTARGWCRVGQVGGGRLAGGAGRRQTRSVEAGGGRRRQAADERCRVGTDEIGRGRARFTGGSRMLPSEAGCLREARGRGWRDRASTGSSRAAPGGAGEVGRAQAAYGRRQARTATSDEVGQLTDGTERGQAGSSGIGPPTGDARHGQSHQTKWGSWRTVPSGAGQDPAESGRRQARPGTDSDIERSRAADRRPTAGAGRADVEVRQGRAGSGRRRPAPGTGSSTGRSRAADGPPTDGAGLGAGEVRRRQRPVFTFSWTRAVVDPVGDTGFEPVTSSV